MGDEVDLEGIRLGPVDRQAHSVDADRPFPRHEAGKLPRQPERKSALITADELSDAVHVTGDEMTSQRVAQAERFLQIYLGRALEARADPQRLARDIRGEAPRGE